MLNEASKTKLVELGFDTDKLTDAIKSDEEIGVDIPVLYKEKGHTKEDLSVFGKNRFDEGKSAMDEMRAKAYKEKYGLDVEGKDLDSIVEAIKQQGFNEAKPSEDSKELQNNFKNLQGKYTELEGRFAAKDAEIELEKFNINLKKDLLGVISDKKTDLSKSDIIDLYLMKNTVKREDGSAVIININGEIDKDNLLNPTKVDTHFKEWFDTSNFTSKGGMGGKDSKGGSTSSKFSNASEFMEWCAANGKDPSYTMSEEGQRYYSANKAK